MINYSKELLRRIVFFLSNYRRIVWNREMDRHKLYILVREWIFWTISSTESGKI